MPEPESTPRLRTADRLFTDLLRVHASVVMDTPEDRELHRRAIATFHKAWRLHIRAHIEPVAPEDR